MGDVETKWNEQFRSGGSLRVAKGPGPSQFPEQLNKILSQQGHNRGLHQLFLILGTSASTTHPTMSLILCSL